VLDLALIIEGTTADQLPEQVLACLQWHRPNLLDVPPCPLMPAAAGAAPAAPAVKPAAGAQLPTSARRSA
jgi:hypothetical protein